jgi:hypothetical protein
LQSKSYFLPSFTNQSIVVPIGRSGSIHSFLPTFVRSFSAPILFHTSVQSNQNMYFLQLKLFLEILQIGLDFIDGSVSFRGVLSKQVLLASTPDVHLHTIDLRTDGHLDGVLVNAVFNDVGTRKNGLDGISRRRKLLMPPVSVATLRCIINTGR